MPLRARLKHGLGVSDAEPYDDARYDASGRPGVADCRRGGAAIRSVGQRDRAFSNRSAPRTEHGGLGGPEPVEGPGSSHGLRPWSMTRGAV